MKQDVRFCKMKQDVNLVHFNKIIAQFSKPALPTGNDLEEISNALLHDQSEENKYKQIKCSKDDWVSACYKHDGCWYDAKIIKKLSRGKFQLQFDGYEGEIEVVHETLMERYLTKEEANEKESTEKMRREAAMNYATESERATLLHRASEIGCLDAVLWLLRNNAVVDAKDRSGFTPLLRAAGAGHLHVVMLLLDWGASCRIRSTVTYQSAYDLAKYYGHENVVRFLEVKTYQQRSEELWRHHTKNTHKRRGDELRHE